MRRTLAGLVAALALLVPLTAAPATAAPAPTERAATGLLVRFSGWGKLELGMSHRQAWNTGMVSKRASRCVAGYDMTWRYADRGFVWWRGDFPNMYVKDIHIRSTIDRTRKDAGVGSTLRQLRRKYDNLSPLTSGSQLQGTPAQAKDQWIVSVQGYRGAISFQFRYGARPTGDSRVEMVTVSRRPMVFWGC